MNLPKLIIESSINEDKTLNIKLSETDSSATVQYPNITPEKAAAKIENELKSLIELATPKKQYEVSFACIGFPIDGPETTVYARTPEEAHKKAIANANKWLKEKGITVYNIGNDYVTETETGKDYRFESEYLG